MTAQRFPSSNMMAPFDGPGGPPNGQVAPPALARPPPMAPNQPNQGLHQHQGAGGPMNHHGGPYGHSGHSRSMQQMHYGMPPSPAGRQSYGSARGMIGNQFSGHPPLHSPHQQGGPPGMPPHPGMQMHHNSSMPPQQPPQPPMRGTGIPMAPHDAMRSSNSNNSHGNRGHYGLDGSSNNNMGGSGRGGGAPAGSWQSDKDTPHRRDMIQQM